MILENFTDDSLNLEEFTKTEKNLVSIDKSKSNFNIICDNRKNEKNSACDNNETSGQLILPNINLKKNAKYLSKISKSENSDHENLNNNILIKLVTKTDLPIIPLNEIKMNSFALQNLRCMIPIIPENVSSNQVMSFFDSDIFNVVQNGESRVWNFVGNEAGKSTDFLLGNGKMPGLLQRMFGEIFSIMHQQNNVINGFPSELKSEYVIKLGCSRFISNQKPIDVIKELDRNHLKIDSNHNEGIRANDYLSFKDAKKKSSDLFSMIDIDRIPIKCDKLIEFYLDSHHDQKNQKPGLIDCVKDTKSGHQIYIKDYQQSLQVLEKIRSESINLDNSSQHWSSIIGNVSDKRFNDVKEAILSSIFVYEIIVERKISVLTKHSKKRNFQTMKLQYCTEYTPVKACRGSIHVIEIKRSEPLTLIELRNVQSSLFSVMELAFELSTNDPFNSSHGAFELHLQSSPLTNYLNERLDQPYTSKRFFSNLFKWRTIFIICLTKTKTQILDGYLRFCVESNSKRKFFPTYFNASLSAPKSTSFDYIIAEELGIINKENLENFDIRLFIINPLKLDQLQINIHLKKVIDKFYRFDKWLYEHGKNNINFTTKKFNDFELKDSIAYNLSLGSNPINTTLRKLSYYNQKNSDNIKKISESVITDIYYDTIAVPEKEEDLINNTYVYSQVDKIIENLDSQEAIDQINNTETLSLSEFKEKLMKKRENDIRHNYIDNVNYDYIIFEDAGENFSAPFTNNSDIFDNARDLKRDILELMRDDSLENISDDYTEINKSKCNESHEIIKLQKFTDKEQINLLAECERMVDNVEALSQLKIDFFDFKCHKLLGETNIKLINLKNWLDEILADDYSEIEFSSETFFSDSESEEKYQTDSSIKNFELNDVGLSESNGFEIFESSGAHNASLIEKSDSKYMNFLDKAHSDSYNNNNSKYSVRTPYTSECDNLTKSNPNRSINSFGLEEVVSDSDYVIKNKKIVFLNKINDKPDSATQFYDETTYEQFPNFSDIVECFSNQDTSNQSILHTQTPTNLTSSNQDDFHRKELKKYLNSKFKNNEKRKKLTFSKDLTQIYNDSIEINQKTTNNGRIYDQNQIETIRNQKNEQIVQNKANYYESDYSISSNSSNYELIESPNNKDVIDNNQEQKLYKSYLLKDVINFLVKKKLDENNKKKKQLQTKKFFCNSYFDSLKSYVFNKPQKTEIKTGSSSNWFPVALITNKEDEIDNNNPTNEAKFNSEIDEKINSNDIYETESELSNEKPILLNFLKHIGNDNVFKPTFSTKRKNIPKNIIVNLDDILKKNSKAISKEEMSEKNQMKNKRFSRRLTD